MLDVQANLAKIIEQMPKDFVPLTIEGSNDHPKAIDFTNIIGRGFSKYLYQLLQTRYGGLLFILDLAV